MQGLENPAKFAAEKFLESVPVSLDVWNVLALISISKNALCDKEKSAKFAEKLKSLEGSEIARTLLEDKFFDQMPDDGRIDKFIDDLNCNWDDLALRDVEDTFALMILALGASNKDVWRKCNKKVVSDLVKRRTMDEKEMLAFYPAKWKADEMFNVKFDEKDALLLSSISGTLITFVYYRYLPAFKSRPIKSGP